MILYIVHKEIGRLLLFFFFFERILKLSPRLHLIDQNTVKSYIFLIFFSFKITVFILGIILNVIYSCDAKLNF